MLVPDRSLKGLHTATCERREPRTILGRSRVRLSLVRASTALLSRGRFRFCARDTRHSVIRVSGVAESVPEEIKG